MKDKEKKLPLQKNTNISNKHKAVAFLTTGLMLFSTTKFAKTVIKFIDSSLNMKSQEQIIKDAELFNADLSMDTRYDKYGNLKQLRFAHNNGNPIWVDVDSDFNDYYEDLIQKSLDKFNEAFEIVNDKYITKIGTPEEIAKAKFKNQNIISFKSKKLDNQIAATASHGKKLLANPLVINPTIYLDLDEYPFKQDNTNAEVKEQNILYTLMHEMYHLMFGSPDIYAGLVGEEISYANHTSFISHGSIFKETLLFSPWDMKNLFAKYYEKHLEKGQNPNEHSQKVNKFIKNYTTFFYGELNKHYKNLYEKNLVYKFSDKLESLAEENGKLILQEPNFQKINLSGPQFDYAGKITGNIYSFSLEDGKYVYILKDSQGQVIETTNGNYVNSDNFIHLEDFGTTESLAFSIKETTVKNKMFLSIYKHDDIYNLISMKEQQVVQKLTTESETNLQTHVVPQQ